MTRDILLVGGTMNQTRAMVAVGRALSEHRCFYTPFYCDGVLRLLSRVGWLDFTAAAGPLRARAMAFLEAQGVAIDDRGEARDYDLVITCTDLLIQRNLRGRRVVLVQEGLTEPEGVLYHLVRHCGAPRFLANTAAFGLSDAYDAFCVASEGYRELFLGKGVRAEKLVVTGIPNFDNAAAYRDNPCPHRDFVLVCTSNARETFKRDNRRRFLRRALDIAAGRPVIFKLHPAERHDRATAEIRSLAPEAMVLRDANTEHLIANATAVVAQYSSVAFTAAALGKEVHSYIAPDLLRRLLPIQNGGTSALHIADVCRGVLESSPARIRQAGARALHVPRQSARLGAIHLLPH